MGNNRKHKEWAACVGLSRISSSRWPWRQQRTEVWSDMISSPYPLHLRLVPNKFIWYNKQGARLRLWIQK